MVADALPPPRARSARQSVRTRDHRGNVAGGLCALEDMDRAIHLAPDDGLLHGYRGLVLVRMHRDSEAQPEFDLCEQSLPSSRGRPSSAQLGCVARHRFYTAAAGTIFTAETRRQEK